MEKQDMRGWKESDEDLAFMLTGEGGGKATNTLSVCFLIDSRFRGHNSHTHQSRSLGSKHTHWRDSGRKKCSMISERDCQVTDQVNNTGNGYLEKERVSVGFTHPSRVPMIPMNFHLTISFSLAHCSFRSLFSLPHFFLSRFSNFFVFSYLPTCCFIFIWRLSDDILGWLAGRSIQVLQCSCRRKRKL